MENGCDCNENNICEYHEDRDKLIAKISNMVNTQAGQWKVLMWGIGIAFTVMLAFIGAQYNAQKELYQTVTDISIATARNTVNITQLGCNVDRFVTTTALNLKDHRDRLRSLEHVKRYEDN